MTHTDDLMEKGCETCATKFYWPAYFPRSLADQMARRLGWFVSNEDELQAMWFCHSCTRVALGVYRDQVANAKSLAEIEAQS